MLDETKLKFGDKVMWYSRSSRRWYRAIFDLVNANGDAIILMHPDDFDRKQISWGHHDVVFLNLRKGWRKLKKRLK